MSKMYDVIIIGGGHAGCEAAAAAARAGAQTALVTIDASKIGEMSCNPAIGGLGKGHLVREIDALDGLMARVADKSGIQFRMLNRSKGPAVHGPRAQIDRALYREHMQSEIASIEELDVIEDAVDDVIIERDRIAGVMCASGATYSAAAVVVTTGTFLNGVIHRGADRIPAGRLGEKPSVKLAERLYALDLPLGRLKTGTPARLNSDTIHWDRLEMQPADKEPVPFSYLTDNIEVPQVACGIAYTNAKAHAIIAENIEASAVYSGAIAGRGPRYCPSIEDKVDRFADRDRHQIFLEPEGLNDKTVYPNGISSSLPADVQDAFIREIEGLEQVEVFEYGYAIEYDYVDPRALGRDLQLKAVPGLFLAGQINGTTGYEEAGAQGLMAGLNAARCSQGLGSVTLGRDIAYIGVMIDDLVTKGVTEPYRMFTSRAEYRLSLRADNADQRLTGLGAKCGIVGHARQNLFHVKHAKLSEAKSVLQDKVLTPAQAAEIGWSVNQDGQRRSLWQFLSYPEIDMTKVLAAFPDLTRFDQKTLAQVEIEAGYASYIERQASDVEAMRRDEALLIPSDLNYGEVGGLSNEVRSKLEAVRPETLGQAGRIEGVTPGALTALLAYVKRQKKRAAA
ncbi:MAG: tRNA uridine-5-carboxymethylaminomethyl(34) synthesis enzyme MnmG [Pseudomonadota bacterium]